MRTNLLKHATLLAILFLCAPFVWADGDYQTAYFTALRARSSTASESTGTGKVQLTLVDITGKQLDGLGTNPNPTDMSAAENGNVVTMLGGTLFATEGIEIPTDLGGQIYATSYSYFKADVYPALGSYFVKWTYANRQITKLDTAMNKDVKPVGTYFKVLPDSTKNGGVKMDGDIEMDAKAMQSMQYVMEHPDSICAIFKKYLLSNPSVTNVRMDNTVGDMTIIVSMDVEGDADKLNIEDFNTDEITFTNNEGENKKWNVQYDKAEKKTYPLNPQKATYTFPVTFTFSEGMSVGVYNSTMTIGMKGEGPSVLQIPIAVTVLDADRPDAILFKGKVKDGNEKGRGSVADLLNQMSQSEPQLNESIIQLQKDNSGDLVLDGKNFTLDFNGNKVGNITITSGEVTIAYSKFGGTARAVTVNGGKLILNGGEFASLTIAQGATVEQNGAAITSVDNKGTLTTTEGQIQGGLTSSGTLIINGGSFAGENAITITNGDAQLNRGSIAGTANGNGVLVRGGTTTIEKLAAISGGTNYSVKNEGGVVNVNCGKFGNALAGSINFVSGYFKDKNYGFDKSADMTELQLTTGVEYNEGYRWFLGTSDAAKNNGVGVCRIGETSYATLEDALAYANNNKDKEVIIFMTNDYTLPAGYYTVPEKATIVVPMSDSQSEVNMIVPRVAFNDADESHPYIQPTEFRRLTLSEGVNMEVFGAIEMSGTQFSSNEPYTGQPYGPYGHLVMAKGSHMTLQAGSEVRAWGYMTGKGEIDARRDSKVREFFQMGDWKGAWTTVQLTGILDNNPENNAYLKAKVFPITQYFIQNIEVPVKYHPGAMLTTTTTVSEGLSMEGTKVNIAMAANDIVIVGVTKRDSAIFVMDNEADAENTWVCKWYDTENDIQTYDVNNSAHIGSMVLDMGNLVLRDIKAHVMLNSAKFDLPIASNMKIHLLSGNMDFMQNTSLLPGAEVEVDKESTVTIKIDPEDKEHTGALYVYDANEWDRYAYRESGENAYTKVVRYTPTWNGTPTRRNEDVCPASAKINVHGTFKTAEGYVYTSESGANIFSSNEDAGTFIFNQDATLAATRKVSQIFGSATLRDKEFSSAQLMNGNGEHEVTTGASAGDAYCYMDNYWTTLNVDEDNECFMVDNHGSFYAKPAEYVKVVATKTDGEISGNTDQTFSDAAGTGRLFILLTAGCQWWEVEKKDNLYHCIHPNNDTYYEWNNELGEWQEKRYTITWRNWDGTEIPTNGGELSSEEDYPYSVPYGTMAEFLGPNPTRDADLDYTYDFIGWTPALGKVTSKVTYTATYERKPRKYTITFCNEGGSVIERQFLTHNEVPVCENVPTKIGHYLQWSPAIAAVTGDATYTATWLEEKPTEYEVRFVDYDGTPLLEKPLTVKVGDTPEYNGVTPTGKAKKAEADGNKEFTYVFDHWSPAIHPVDAAITYTAVYKEVARTYKVEFIDELNTLIESHDYEYGAIPVCSKTPTKANDVQYTYTLAWEPQIAAVHKDQTYQAKWSTTINKYTVTLRSNNDAVCTFTGAGIHNYGEKVTIAANVDDEYEFVRWEERTGGANLGEIDIFGDITLTAVVKTKDKDITNLEISADKTVDVAALGDKEVMDLVITSNGTTSGQLKNADQLIVRGSAYFDLSLGFAANTWYAFGLPWRVNTNGGLSVNGQTLVVDNNCYILEYDGARRATGNVDAQTGYWNYVHAGATLQPGRLYMLYLTNSAQTVRFVKAPNTTLAPIVNTTINVAAYTSSDAKNAGWNGIANPTTCDVNLASDVIETGKGQKYVPGRPKADGTAGDSYMTFNLADDKLAVGQPLFVQVKETKTFVANNENNKFLAPRREMSFEDVLEYELRIAPMNVEYTDRLYISAMDEKDDTYVIGQDLAKISVSRGAAQFWVERYDAKLSVNATELDSDNKAAFPLGIYAPKAGNYELSTVTSVPNDKELLLTYDGMPVKDLSTGTYTAALQAGTTRHYGLLLVHKAPQITTGGGMVETNSSNIRKVLVGGQVYIIRDGNIYSIFGQQIQ